MSTSRRVLRRYLPPQHGAWAMLLVPWLAGVLVAGFRWPHLPLLCAWIAGYLCSYYLLQAIKTHRPGRVRRQLWAYATPAVLLGGLVLALRPELLWMCLYLLFLVPLPMRRTGRSPIRQPGHAGSGSGVQPSSGPWRVGSNQHGRTPMW